MVWVWKIGMPDERIRNEQSSTELDAAAAVFLWLLIALVELIERFRPDPIVIIGSGFIIPSMAIILLSIFLNKRIAMWVLALGFLMPIASCAFH